MHANLQQLTSEVANTLGGTDCHDLQSLARIHTLLNTLEDQAAAAADASHQPLASAGADLRRLVEKIILNEVEDSETSFRRLQDSFSALRAMVEGLGSMDTALEAPSLVTAPAAASAAATSFAPPPPPPAVAAVVHTLQTIEPEAVIGEMDAPLAMEFVTESMGHLEAAEAALLELENDPTSPEPVGAVFRSFHTIKGVAGFLGLKQIGKLAHAAENLLGLARDGVLTLQGGTIDLTLGALDLMRSLVNDLEAAMCENRAPATDPRIPEMILKLEQCASGTPVAGVAAFQATAAAAARQQDQIVEPSMASTAGRGGEPAAEGGSARESSGDSTVKVSTTRLDSLINMVGELVISQSMVQQDSGILTADNPRLSRNLSHLGKITRELQDLSMSMRMVPIQGVFQKMARLARDTARKAGKEIEFVMVGAETELDRNVVEAVSDPLVHMVRNAVDHGIEPPDVRAEVGKARQGRVELRAYHQAGSIVIQISDDGRGLNLARILEKARAAGIVGPEQELPDQEIAQLIFHAGLSTAEKVTDISGRGVGMDVVKKNIEALRGRVEIATTAGKGSVFTIRLPLTLAMIDGMLVRVGEQRYIIPITTIEQSARPRPEQVSTVQGRGEMCMVRGRLLPVIRLADVFSVPGASGSVTDAIAVTIQDNERRACVAVDELLGQQQVVIKSLGDSFGQIAGISGGAILGDGTVCLIIDPPGLIDLASGCVAAA